MTDQLSLFPDAFTVELESRRRALDAVAAALPPGLRLGTSSWSFPGWHGIVYSRRSSEAELARDGLREYSRHPLLRTVGIDRGFYAPISEEDLRRYAAQLPDGFLCCTKAPASVTSPLLGDPRLPNPDFLVAERFTEEMLEPFARAFARHAGPFLLQFPPLPLELRKAPSRFLDGLDRMLAGLPRDFQYAVELRDAALFAAPYSKVLARHGAAHVYNYWSAMPRPGAQALRLTPAAAPFVIVRLLMRPGTRYETRRESFAPFDRIVDRDVAMRRDVIDIVTEAARRQARTYVLVNNKAEGSAPLTIEEIAREIADARASGG
jgi:uncharacterized protein YecE (DUF72 family)